MSSVVMLEGRRLHTKLAEGWLADASEHVRRADAEHGSLMLKNAILRAKGYPIQPLAPIAVEQPKKLEVPKFRKRTVKNGAPNKGGRPGKRYSNGPMITRIIGLMSERYAMSVETITGHDKRNANILPRHLAMFLARKKTSASLPEIGRYFDGRDHTTIRHAVLRIEKLAASGDVETIEALHFAYQRLGA